MKRKIILILMILNCFLAFAKDTSEQTANVSGKDFYFAYLAYKDYSSQPKIIFRQDKDRVNDRIEHLKSLRINTNAAGRKIRLLEHERV